MASGGKKKTTMAKLTRESKLRERRLDKQAGSEMRASGRQPINRAVPGDAVDPITAVSAQLGRRAACSRDRSLRRAADA